MKKTKTVKKTKTAKKSKTVKKSKAIFFRYEFSNEKGKPEGGDIFEFSSLKQAEEMILEVLNVAKLDGVAVNLTVGTEKPFVGFLKNAGMSLKDIELEKVGSDTI